MMHKTKTQASFLVEYENPVTKEVEDKIVHVDFSTYTGNNKRIKFSCDNLVFYLGKSDFEQLRYKERKMTGGDKVKKASMPGGV